MKETSNRDSSNWESGDLNTLSSLSEPPDIRNWFSSYVYESPELDELESIISDEPKFRTIDNCVNERGEKFGGNEEKEKMGLIQKDTFTSGFAELSSCHKNNQHGDHFVSKYVAAYFEAEQWIERNKNQSLVETLASESVSEQRLEGKTILRVEDSPNNDSEGSSLVDADDFVLLYMNNISTKTKGKYVERTLQTEGLTARQSNVVVLDGPSTETIAEKVTEKTSLAGNGFMSTRNNRRKRDNDENSVNNQQQIEVGRLRNMNKDLSSKCPQVQRKALSEKTNLQYSIEFSTAGKWKCPQKNKPNLGPPLKQLRLEQWVGRV